MDTRFYDAEEILKDIKDHNLYAMSVFVEGATFRYLMEKQQEDYDLAIERLHIAAGQASAVNAKHAGWGFGGKTNETLALQCEAYAFEGNAYQFLGLVLFISGGYMKVREKREEREEKKVLYMKCLGHLLHSQGVEMLGRGAEDPA
jgi:hypothetical protein